MSSFETTENEGALLISLVKPGDLNEFGTSDFRESLYAAAERSPLTSCVLDLAPADYLASSAIATLIGLQRRSEKRGGKLVLLNVHPNVVDVLRVMNLLKFFRLAQSLTEAHEALRSAPTA